MNADQLLGRLREVVLSPESDREDLLRAMEDLLVWLNANNSDQNCRKVDLFVSTQIDPKSRSLLPQDVAEILFDMAGALHDTHTSPEVATNFFSTPGQLLQRLMDLKGRTPQSP